MAETRATPVSPPVESETGAETPTAPEITPEATPAPSLIRRRPHKHGGAQTDDNRKERPDDGTETHERERDAEASAA